MAIVYLFLTLMFFVIGVAVSGHDQSGWWALCFIGMLVSGHFAIKHT